jgi:hypothetical protein
MKAKEKAMEIAMKFDKRGETDNAKECVLICIDEMLAFDLRLFDIEFLKEVKQEINKL